MTTYGNAPRHRPRSFRAVTLRLPGLPRGPKGLTLGPLAADLPQRLPPPPPEERPSPPEHGFPDPPVDWQDSQAEWAIYWAHSVLRRGEPGQVWFYKTPFAGELWTTGFAPDFLETDIRIAIDVLGPAPGADQRGIVRLREVVMRAVGFDYVVIDEGLALANPITALRDALGGARTSVYQ